MQKNILLLCTLIFNSLSCAHQYQLQLQTNQTDNVGNSEELLNKLALQAVKFTTHKNKNIQVCNTAREEMCKIIKTLIYDFKYNKDTILNHLASKNNSEYTIVKFIIDTEYYQKKKGNAIHKDQCIDFINKSCSYLSTWKTEGKPASGRNEAIKKISAVIMLTKAHEDSGIEITENDIEKDGDREIFKTIIAECKKILQL